MVEFTSVLCVCFECRSFEPAPPLFAARMIKCSEPNLTGGFPTPSRFTLRGGETYYARYSFRQSVVRAGLDHTLSVATVCRMISPAGAGGREVCVEKYYTGILGRIGSQSISIVRSSSSPTAIRTVITLFAARMIKCSEPNLTGGFPTPSRFTLRGGETYYARYSFRQSVVRAGLDHTLSVATVCRMISPAGAGGREVCVEKYYTGILGRIGSQSISIVRSSSSPTAIRTVITSSGSSSSIFSGHSTRQRFPE